jgi:hypothetical protein
MKVPSPISNLEKEMENSFKITEHIEVFGNLHQVTVTVWLLPDGDWDYRVCHGEHDITLEVNRFDAELIEKKIQKCCQKKKK